MHEFSLLNDLMGKIFQIAADNGNKPVVGLKVRIGALAHISPEHFAEHFHHAARGTVAEGAQLDAVLMPDESAPDAQDIVLESVEIEQ